MRLLASLGLVAMLTGCATPLLMVAPPAPSPKVYEKKWQGRLSMTVQTQPPRAMSASFLLEGDARTGELLFYSPLGTTMASLQWNPLTSQLIQGHQQRRFDSIEHLTEELTGAALPINAMFDWLEGTHSAAPGWQVDLSAFADGSVVAKRSSPEPMVLLRIKLDAP